MKGIIEAINAESLKAEVPSFNVGDTVRVGFKIIEGGKERVQNFEGVGIAKKTGGIPDTFTASFCNAAYVVSWWNMRIASLCFLWNLSHVLRSQLCNTLHRCV